MASSNNNQTYAKAARSQNVPSDSPETVPQTTASHPENRKSRTGNGLIALRPSTSRASAPTPAPTPLASSSPTPPTSDSTTVQSANSSQVPPNNNSTTFQSDDLGIPPTIFPRFFTSDANLPSWVRDVQTPQDLVMAILAESRTNTAFDINNPSTKEDMLDGTVKLLDMIHYLARKIRPHGSLASDVDAQMERWTKRYAEWMMEEA